MIASLFLDFVHTKRNKITLLQYSIGLSITIISIVSVMISRVYLAAHSINQVVYGATIGLEIALFMHFTVKP